MSEPTAPRPFKEGPAEDAVSARLKDSFSELPSPSMPPAQLRAAILSRAADDGRSQWRRRFLLFTSLAMAGAAAAAMGGALLSHRQPPPLPVVPLVAQPAPADVAVVPAPAPEAPPAPSPHRSVPTARPRPKPAPVTPGPDVPSEAEALGKAVRALRQGGDSKAALAALQSYFEQFPNGQLGAEARLAEIEALVNVGDTDRALERLSPERIQTLPRSADLFALRGEILVKRGDCTAAQVAFDKAQELAPEDPEILARTRRGRLACPTRADEQPSE